MIVSDGISVLAPIPASSPIAILRPDPKFTRLLIVRILPHFLKILLQRKTLKAFPNFPTNGAYESGR